MTLSDPCPGCGGKNHHARVRGKQATKHCTGCGYTASLHNTSPGFVVAKPTPVTVPARRTLPHHYHSFVLAVFALVVLILFFRLF